MTIPGSHRLGFFKPGLWDRGMVADVYGRKCVWKKKMKKPGLWDRGMVTGGPGQKSDWKKITRVCQTVIWSMAGMFKKVKNVWNGRSDFTFFYLVQILFWLFPRKLASVKEPEQIAAVSINSEYM